MRIDNYANILASAKTNVPDLMSRLNPGDVIRAKVLEITSDEVVLKLFDGTVMRAGMLEAMNAKAGDMVMLAVSSKLEGTLYLETVKNISQMTESNPDTLGHLLETLQIKPDAQNMELASEFIKAGVPVTSDQIKQAAELLSSNPALNSEKAVFMTLKGIKADSANVELLSKLLEGDLKLGQQLKEVQILLDQAGTASNDKTFATLANPALAEKTAALETNKVNVLVTNQSNNTDESQIITAQTNMSQTNTTGTEKNPAKLPSQIQSADIMNDPADLPAVSGMSQDINGDSASTGKAIFRPEPSISAKSATNTAFQELIEHKINETEQSESRTADRFSKLIDAVRDIYVKTDSDKLSSELDANKINIELNEKLELLKETIQSSEELGPATRKGLSATAAQIEDTQRQLHQMNASNILYYQIPVNLAGQDSTAELYVMNRRQNKKKIDPNDTVMFISLDTANMGRVESLLDIKNRNITVNLRTESKQINDFIKTQITDLYTGLAACGYKLAGIRYAIIDKAASPIQQERLLNGIAHNNHGKVDYRI